MDNAIERQGGVSGVLEQSAVERSAIARITWRIVPFLMLCYFVAFIDRVNVGFAALHMNKDLGFSSTVYGVGAGIFFIGYFLFEVPSNLMLERVGARLWIARIMLTWGIVSGCMALVTGIWSYYAVRFVLGVAEAGFFPGVILFLTYWFPARHRARIVGIFMIAIPVSNALGSVISGALLSFDGLMGLHGWQWLFILEAIPPMILGVMVLWLLPSRPAEAAWLPDGEKAWLTGQLDAEQALIRTQPNQSLFSIMSHPRVLVLALVYAGSVATNYGLTLWQPQIIKGYGYSDMVTGLLNALPFVVGSIGMIWWGRRSDQGGERVWHTASALLISAVGLAACLVLTGLVPTMLALCVALFGCYALKGPFWALSTEWLAAGAAAAGIAQINAIGNLAGFVGPFMIGWIKDMTGSFTLGLLPLIALAVIAAIAVLMMARAAPAVRAAAE